MEAAGELVVFGTKEILFFSLVYILSAEPSFLSSELSRIPKKPMPGIIAIMVFPALVNQR
jgi:hypothetical protein